MAGVELITGGWFASAIISKVVDQGRSYLGDNYDLHTGTREMLTNLEIQLPRIQSVIEAAEKRQITNKGLYTWLEQLKDAAYEAEDVLDLFQAKRIRDSMKGKGKVSEIASSSGKTVKNLIFHGKDLKKLKSVVQKLDKLCMGDFIKALQALSDKGKEHLGNLGSETSSYLAPGVTIFGRDEEIQLILDMILNVLYGDFNHKPLDDPNLQQEGEGSSSLSDNIFKNWLSWGLPGNLMHIWTVIKGDTPEQSKKGLLGMSESGKSMSSGTIKNGDAPEQSTKEALGLSESGKSMFSDTVKKGDAPEQIKKGLFDLSEFEKYVISGTVEKGDVPKHIKERLVGLTESGKSMFSGTIIKGDAPVQSKNRVTTITTIAEPHSINNQKLAVIPIVGLGGVGKTTVAKIIYNDERVKEHFALEAWVYVSENHDAKKIMQEMLCSFKVWGFDPGYSQNLNIVEEMLIETIKNRRFLLILDDLTDRTEHIWSRLRSVLYYGEVGSVIVVTTQSPSIANTIGTLPEVKIDVLKQDSFWELFQYYAFGGFKYGNQPTLPLSEQEELKKIGKQIAEKLHGLPLAGEVIGTLLSTRLEKEFWEDICGNNWWNIEGAREKILPSIGVGYNYLESELKQCFVFCSIFPKQYVFERERLVQMWIAQGFIQPNKEEKGRLDIGEIRLEDIGRKWFGKLIDRIFFQPTLSDGKYVMHALVRDLAIVVSSNEFCFVKSHDKHLPSSARHLGIDCDNSEVELKCENSTRLRTMILFGNWTNGSDKFIRNIFANYKGLRLLDLSYIVLETIEDPINATCLLWHLRFVDLSFTGIKSIPDEFCALCHLQVLDVRGCNFEKLPKGINQLINLRHLYASSDTISLISSIGKLTKLQELEEFRIEKSEGHRISELKDMDEISGHLLLSKLQNVYNKEEAAESKLDKKKYLKSLELRFDYIDDNGPTTEVKMEILDALKPTPSLEILKVMGCYGESLPGWMCSSHPVFYNLKVIHVSRFRLRSLPAFGELPFLELLSFLALSIDEVGSNFYGSSHVIFPSLKELTFSLMPFWINWEDGEDGKTIFPHLKKLHLKDCWALRTLPMCSLTSVVELTLSNCWEICNIQTVQMPSLAHFSMTGQESVSIDCTRLISLEVLHLTDIDLVYFVGGLKYLVKLRELVIINSLRVRHTYEEHPLDEISHEEYENQCLQSLTYLHLCSGRTFFAESITRLGRLPSLRTLLIEKFFSSHCNMEDEESWFIQLTSLEKLEFRNCRRLSCLPSQLHLLTSLKKLQISSCPDLRSLPENGLPPNLAELCIEECPDLIRRCQPDQGDDWHKISHIPFIHFNGEIGTLLVQSPSVADRGVNDTLLSIYPTRTVFDKTGTDEIFFPFNLSGTDKGKVFFSLI